MIVLLITAVVVILVGSLILGPVFGSRDMGWLARLIWVVSLSVGTILLGQGGYAVAAQVAYNDAVGNFHQFLNGTVVAADRAEVPCDRDGDCEYTYDCDPYLVPHYTYDSKGHLTGVYYTTSYHQCPYAQKEYDFTTTDSIGGTQSFGATIGTDPVAWRSGEAIPDSIPRENPVDWQRARTALDQGRGLPMTEDNLYNNYILASDSSLLHASSDNIAELKKDKLLPTHTKDVTHPIHDTFDADKVSFVGFAPTDKAEWEDAVMQFNATLGSELRGDLHVVIVKASALPGDVSSEDYANAVKAYWLNDFGKYAFGKNGIMVVIGIDDSEQTIEWAHADTGMPIGNGTMREYLQASLLNTPYSLASVMGSTYAKVDNGKASYVIGQGLIPQAIMVDTPFRRACMECTDKGENGGAGFVDVTVNAPVTPLGYFLTILAILPILVIAWGIFFYWCSVATNNVSWQDQQDEIRRRQDQLQHLLKTTSRFHRKKRQSIQDEIDENRFNETWR